MARWTGLSEVDAVLEAGDSWKARCFLGNTSILSDRPLWTPGNLGDFFSCYTSNPIADSNRDFLDKLQEQLNNAAPAVKQLAAETMWFLYLFCVPSSVKPETKRETIQKIWAWSGESAPQGGFLDDKYLMGVGHPGTGYLTHRHPELEYVLRVVMAFKSFQPDDRKGLLETDPPWEFAKWLDQQEGSDRRLARNVFLYFLFPDYMERNVSRDHREQIYEAFKGKLPPDRRIIGRNRTDLDYDRAISEIRKVLEEERATKKLDFYQPDIKNQWFTAYRDGRRKDFRSWLDAYLKDRGLRLNQSGRDTSMEKLSKNDLISPETGFWSSASGLTAKPPRWLIHFDLVSAQLTASVPNEHRSRVVGFANTKGGDSGALGVRILPIAKIGDHKYQTIETWEWLLLFCFPGGLKPGSAAQAFDDFDPTTGVLTYMGESIPYIFSGLLCLNDPDDAFSVMIGGTAKTITYREATEQLAKLIHTSSVGAANG